MSETIDKKFERVASEDFDTLGRRYEEACVLAEQYHALVMNLASGGREVFEQHQKWFAVIDQNLEQTKRVLGQADRGAREPLRDLIGGVVRNIEFMKTQLGLVAAANDMTHVVPFPGVSVEEVEARGTVTPDDGYVI